MRIAILILAALLVGAGSNTSWLDASTPANWNTGALPKAPAEHNPDIAPGGRCVSAVRRPFTAEDRAVVRAGWKLWGAYQRYNGTVIVLGMASIDGMCRPLEYQAFVFSAGTFAGTLSPHRMDARTDASLSLVRLYAEREFSADFARYGANDPLCCPYGTTTVFYKLQSNYGRDLVTPDSTLQPQPASTATPHA